MLDKGLEATAAARTVASAGTVVRRPTRIIAWDGTRLAPVTSADLVPSDLAGWWSLRQGVESRRRGRTLGRRFRRDPEGFLRSLESALIKPAPPP